jgi:hypothetical protein
MRDGKRKGNRMNVQNDFAGKCESKRPLVRSRRRWKFKVKMEVKTKAGLNRHNTGFSGGLCGDSHYQSFLYNARHSSLCEQLMAAQ